MSMVTRSVWPVEWRVTDRTEDLKWIRLIHYQGRPTFVYVTKDGWVVAGRDRLRDVAGAFPAWKCAVTSRN
ncbi:hypothetical protein B0H03_104202 [Rathayibacter iranicus NCPPB 2253 = VKM Ac-1602]|nr:hypothetical protein B0H03_104202 [Rathayibacter iranicus NCPPB 2253 = VKM Ac-1602]